MLKTEQVKSNKQIKLLEIPIEYDWSFSDKTIKLVNL